MQKGCVKLASILVRIVRRVPLVVTLSKVRFETIVSFMISYLDSTYCSSYLGLHLRVLPV